MPSVDAIWSGSARFLANRPATEMVLGFFARCCDCGGSSATLLDVDPMPRDGLVEAIVESACRGWSGLIIVS
jgi:hypothetical protein